MVEVGANSVIQDTVNPQRDEVEGTLNSTCNKKKSKACFKLCYTSNPHYKYKAFSLFHQNIKGLRNTNNELIMNNE
jgi:hypothetical protein